MSLRVGVSITFGSGLFPFQTSRLAVELTKELRAKKKDHVASGSLCHTEPAICYDTIFSHSVHHLFPHFFFLVYYVSLPLSRHVLDHAVRTSICTAKDIVGVNFYCTLHWKVVCPPDSLVQIINETNALLSDLLRFYIVDVRFAPWMAFGLEERWQVAVAQCSTVSHLAEHRTQLVPVGRGGLHRLHETFVTLRSVATAASVQLDLHRAAERLADEILIELDLRFEAFAAALRYTQTIGAQ